MNLEEKIKMMYLHRIELSIAVIVLALVINLLLRFKWTRKTIEAIIDDTLKVNDGAIRRFSGTKITMFVAFISLVWGFHYITIKDGFNDVAFITMACIATGVSIAGAYSKKINPPTETTTEEKPKE